jgi:hypothetical protein
MIASYFLTISIMIIYGVFEDPTFILPGICIGLLIISVCILFYFVNNNAHKHTMRGEPYITIPNHTTGKTNNYTSA